MDCRRGFLSQTTSSSEKLELAENGIFNGVHVLSRHPVDPVPNNTRIEAIKQ